MMQLESFFFPVEERPVAVFNGHNDLIDLENNQTYLRGPYRAIVRSDTNELISIVQDSYKLIPNRILIEHLLEELEKMDARYYIDPSHSFVRNNRMRLQITFPELTFKDSESEIALSLFLHNSYDMSEGVRMYFGAIRHICTNGMVFGKVFARFYGKHTSGFEVTRVRDALVEAMKKIPEIETRIRAMEQRGVSKPLKDKIRKELGKKLTQEILKKRKMTEWALYNALTYMISHMVDQRLRARYQMALSRAFHL